MFSNITPRVWIHHNPEQEERGFCKCINEVGSAHFGKIHNQDYGMGLGNGNAHSFAVHFYFFSLTCLIILKVYKGKVNQPNTRWKTAQIINSSGWFLWRKPACVIAHGKSDLVFWLMYSVTCQEAFATGPSFIINQPQQPERDSSNSSIFIFISLHGDRSAVISGKRRPSSERGTITRLISRWLRGCSVYLG